VNRRLCTSISKNYSDAASYFTHDVSSHIYSYHNSTLQCTTAAEGDLYHDGKDTLIHRTGFFIFHTLAGKSVSLKKSRETSVELGFTGQWSMQQSMYKVTVGELGPVTYAVSIIHY